MPTHNNERKERGMEDLSMVLKKVCSDAKRIERPEKKKVKEPESIRAPWDMDEKHKRIEINGLTIMYFLENNARTRRDEVRIGAVYNLTNADICTAFGDGDSRPDMSIVVPAGGSYSPPMHKHGDVMVDGYGLLQTLEDIESHKKQAAIPKRKEKPRATWGGFMNEFNVKKEDLIGVSGNGRR